MQHDMSIGNRKLAYLDTGHGPTLLFGHSFLWDSAMWRPQVEVLSKQFRCIVPDLWGHGDSDNLQQDTYTLAELASDYRCLLDRLQVDDCYLIGLSVGGMWGTELALQAPQRIKGLVIMDTYVGAEPEQTQQQYFQLIDSVASLKHFPDTIIDVVAPLFFGQQTVASNNTLFTQFKTHLRQYPAANIATIQTLSRTIFARADLRPRLTELRDKPCLVMVGKEDVPRPPQEAHEMAQLLACPCIEIEHAGHIANLEQPNQVTQALLDFIMACEQ